MAVAAVSSCKPSEHPAEQPGRVATCALLDEELVGIGESSTAVLERVGKPLSVYPWIGPGFRVRSRWEYRTGMAFFEWTKGSQGVLTSLLGDPKGLSCRIVRGVVEADDAVVRVPPSIKCAEELE